MSKDKQKEPSGFLYHITDENVHIMAEKMIKQNKELAEKLLWELDMQLSLIPQGDKKWKN